MNFSVEIFCVEVCLSVCNVQNEARLGINFLFHSILDYLYVFTWGKTAFILKNTEDSKNEYLTKLFKAKTKIIIGKIIFKLFFEILLKFNNIIKIIRDAIEYNNCGFGELTKNKVIGVIRINCRIK